MNFALFSDLEQKVNNQTVPNTQTVLGTQPTYRLIGNLFGTFAGTPTKMKFYDSKGKKQEIFDLANKYGYQVKISGGKYGDYAGDIKKYNYSNKYLLIYDPSPEQGGCFDDEEYTLCWRVVHELSHALTEKDANDYYGFYPRKGSVWEDLISTQVNQLDPFRFIQIKRKALRAVYWEVLAHERQRNLYKEIGVEISDEDYNTEVNINLSDAVHRALYGKFVNIEQEGFSYLNKKILYDKIVNFINSKSRDIAKLILGDELFTDNELHAFSVI